MGNTIKTQQEVEAFLRQFMPKFDIWGIVFLNREKNLDTLFRLGLTEAARKDIVRSIDTLDYVETIEDALSYGEMWVFGKDYDGQELYIKISLGQPSSQTICISFHIAEHPIRYAFK